jgi:hypothetical protein
MIDVMLVIILMVNSTVTFYVSHSMYNLPGPKFPAHIIRIFALLGFLFAIFGFIGLITNGQTT